MNHFKNIVCHSLQLYGKTLNPCSIIGDKSLQHQIIDFASLSNFVALKGGLLKKEQMLSGTMADIFSNLYLALSVQNYHNNHGASILLTEYISKKLINENQRLINTVIDNLGVERIFVLHLNRNVKIINLHEERAVFV